MKCLSCDVPLSDFEATRRYESSGEFVDLCNSCFYKSDLQFINILERHELELANSEQDNILDHEK